MNRENVGNMTGNDLDTGNTRHSNIHSKGMRKVRRTAQKVAARKVFVKAYTRAYKQKKGIIPNPERGNRIRRLTEDVMRRRR